MSNFKPYFANLQNKPIRELRSVLFLIAVFIYGCTSSPVEKPQTLPSLPVFTVTSDTATTFMDYPSSIEGISNVEIRPEVTGKLNRLLVDEGSYVQKGQPLFLINELPFRQREANAKAVLRSALGALNSSKIEVEKLVPLVKSNVVSAYQLKTAEAAREMAEGNVEQARAGLKTAQIELGYTIVKAPSIGYIGRLTKKEGSIISQTDVEPLTLLSDIQNVHVYFSMSETDFLDFKDNYEGRTVEEKIKKLPPVSLILADKKAYGHTGSIDMIDGQFDRNTGAVTLRATFPNPDRLLRSGNTGKIRLSVLRKDVSIIPQEATLELQDKIFVFVLGDSNKVSKQPIKIAGKSNDRFFVKVGIKAGTRIVASGIEHVAEGQKIIPQEAAPIKVSTKQNKPN